MQDIPLNRLKFETALPSGFSNRKATGKLPDKLPDPLFLNLGCGNDVRDGFINIDLYSDNPEVVYMDIRKLVLPSGSVSLILANDILEHFSHRETNYILSEWNRVLKPEGELILRVPSLKLQIKAYNEGKWDADIASYMIFGGQTNPGDYHCIGFDAVSIKKHLEETGFKVIDIREYDTPQDKGFINLNMTVKAQKFVMKEEKKVQREPDLFDGLDFESIDEKYIEKPVDTEENSDIPSIDDDISLLAEIVDADDNPIDEDLQIQKSEHEQMLNIVWEGSQFVNHSLALINREQSYNLIKTKAVNLTIVPYEEETFEPENSDKYKVLRENDVRYKPEVDDKTASLPYLWVRHQWPPKAEPPQGAKWVIMQPWEFSRLRKDIVEIFNNADEVWTPSLFSRDSFVNSGVDPNKVQIIPNGIDPELFKPYGEKFKLYTSKKLKLLYVGGTTWRKGFDVLLDVYTQLFTSDDDITLIVKDMGTGTFYKGQTAEEQIKNIQAQPGKPEIIYMNDDLSEEEMASLYRACNLLVSPYRGEGFSLPALEAMASGLPVVVTKGGATDDFTNDKYALYIDSEERNIGDEIDGYKLTDNAFVLEPDKEHFAHILKTVYEKPNVLYPMGLIAQEFAREKMTWKRSTLKIISRIDSLYDLNIGIEAQKVLIDNADEYIKLGRAEKLFDDNEFENAFELYKSINTNNLEDKEKMLVYIRLADLNIAYDNDDISEQYLEKAISLNMPNPDLEYLKTMLLFRKGKKTEALEVIAPLMQYWIKTKFDSIAGINLDDLLVLTADILLDDEDLEGANQLYTEALKYNPENPFACYGAGKCFKQAGATNEAKEMFEWAIKLSPGFMDAKQELEQL